MESQLMQEALGTSSNISGSSVPLNLKRRREDENFASNAAITVGSSTKRAKRNDGDGPLSEELIEQNASDTTMETMQQLISAANSIEGKESVLSDECKTWEGILQRSRIVLECSVLSLEPSWWEHLPLQGHLSTTHKFIDFLWYRNFEDENATAATATLVSISSRNLSPESTISDTDEIHHTSNVADATDTKFDYSFDFLEPLTLGIFEEIDGGESAYYAGPSWKWDGRLLLSNHGPSHHNTC
jgi:hypothetical protein